MPHDEHPLSRRRLQFTLPAPSFEGSLEGRTQAACCPCIRSLGRDQGSHYSPKFYLCSTPRILVLKRHGAQQPAPVTSLIEGKHMKISKFLLAYHMPTRRRLGSGTLFALPMSGKPILVLTVTNCNVSKRCLRRWILPNLRQVIGAEGFSSFTHLGGRDASR